MRAVAVLVGLIALGLLQAGAAVRPAAIPSIYSLRADDPWNRIFGLLFTRTISAAKTEEFSAAAPFSPSSQLPGSILRFGLSTRTFDVQEDGDRAVEALYPSFFTARGTGYLLDEPRRTQFAQAVDEALGDAAVRAPLDRALMQADLWSAFDALAAVADPRRREPGARQQAAASLTPLVAGLMRKLALSDDEIAALPDNYAAARRTAALPDVFAPDGEWMEVVLSPHREHDTVAGLRRASRVFVRPVRPAAGERPFLDSLTGSDRAVATAALLMQTLVVDSRGRVRPTRLISDVQIRVPHAPGGGAAGAEEFELSRRLLRADAASGGFKHFPSDAPAFFPIAGNDYGFATPARGSRGEAAAIVSTLGTRCAACHGVAGAGFMTFDLIPVPGVGLPPVKRLPQPNDTRALEVVRQKEARDDYARLMQLAGFPR